MTAAQLRPVRQALRGTTDRLRSLPWRPVILSFLVARVVVGLAHSTATLVSAPVVSAGLLSWDAAWYLEIAQHGYHGVVTEGRRFFPVLPLLTRMLGVPLGGDLGLALLVQSNVCAIVYAFLAHRLCLLAGFRQSVADRMPWVVAFAPASFVLAMGYSEAIAGVLVCTVLWCLQRRLWWPVVLAGIVAGALRPTGVVLMLPVLMEAARGFRDSPAAERVQRVLAVAAPAAGLAAYLGWSWWAFGDPLQPLTAQTQSGLRGGVAVNPVGTVVRGVTALLSGDLRHAAAPMMHLIWVVLAIVVLVAARRVLPASWLAFTAATLLLGLTARNFSSFERYAASAVPLLIAAAWLLEERRVRVVARVVAPAALFGYCVTMFLRAYIP